MPQIVRRARLRRRAPLALLLAVAALGATGCVLPPAPPPAGSGYRTTIVPAGNGFGGGTIYEPDSTTTNLGGVAVVPGFISPQSAIAWYGPLLAKEGFVVITIDTLSGWDQPASRGTQLLAALDYLTGQSAAKARVNPNRLAVMGWSMGGGGALEAARTRPSLKAAVPLAGWNTNTNFSTVTVPTLVVACQNDSVATNASHSTPFYNSLPAATPKAYLEIAGGSHSCVGTQNANISTQVVAWMDRFVNGDTTASARLCPPPPVGGGISASRSSCPY